MPSSVRERGQAETRARLLHHGARLLAKHGLARTRAVDIARAASVAVGTLYLHFGDKNGLLHEILLLGIIDLRQTLRVFTDSVPSGYEQAVRQQTEALLAYCEQRPDVARLLFHPEICQMPAGRDVLDFLLLTHENQLREGIACGAVRAQLDAQVAAQATVGMLLHVLSWWCEDPTRESRDVVAATVSEMRLRGTQRAAPGG